jgi:GT2 family glycosyltransferase
MAHTAVGSIHQLIEKALTAYQSGRLVEAFQAIDRVCRLTVPAAEHMLLRGVVLSELGSHEEAAAAIDAAYRLAPSNPVIRRQLFARQMPLLDQPRLKNLALQLAGADPDSQLLDLVSSTLGLDERSAVGYMSQQDGRVVLTLAGATAETLTVQLHFDGAPMSVEINMDHHVQGTGRFHYRGSTAVRWPTGVSSAEVQHDNPDILWFRTRLINLAWQRTGTAVGNTNSEKTGSGSAGEADVTIIVPVYGDIQATVRCIVSLLSDRTSKTHWHLVIVNDNSPEPDMNRLVELADRDARVTTVSNSFNMGFIGAINAALHRTERSDVVLLNSDTIVSPGWIDRLRSAAQSDRKIGTVTPLTNNGELVSFPEPFRINPMPAEADIAVLDRLASEVNAGDIVDLPTGIGFCLYIKRACLDAVGYLDDQSYERGYLEEVDFCQRAVARGFANVCATNVFVGHVGNASFGAQKSFLVARNSEEVGRRYPVHNSQCRLFMDADPLRLARTKLQHAWMAARDQPSSAAVYISSSRVVDSALVSAVAARLSTTVHTNLLVLTGWLADEGKIIVHDLSGGLPHALSVPLTGPPGISGLKRALGRFDVASWTLLDADRSLDPLILEIVTGDVAANVIIVDGSPVCPRGDLVAGGVRACYGAVSALSCVDCLQSSRPPMDHMSKVEIESFRALRAHLLEIADHVYVPVPEAERIMSIAGVERVPSHLALRQQPRQSTTSGAELILSTRSARPCLGIIPIHETTADFERLMALVRVLFRDQVSWQIVVLGETLDDDALMHLGDVHVTGLIAPEEMPGMLRALGCSAIFVDMRGTSFAHPILDAIRGTVIRMTGWDTTGLGDFIRNVPGAKVMAMDTTSEELAHELDMFMQSVADDRT